MTTLTKPVDHESQSHHPVNRRSFLVEAAASTVVASAVVGCASTPNVPRTANELPVPNPAPFDKNSRLFSFVGGETGSWSVISVKAVVGETLPTVARVDIVNDVLQHLPVGAAWCLHGVTSNERYVTRGEKDQLVAQQAALGRADARYGAIIPIRKNAAWWGLTQDERRAIFAERARHVTIGMKYLPAIARKLHHCRDVSQNEPFDFITLFDYAQAHTQAFEDMVAELRASEEWKFVDREVDIRLMRAGA